MKSAAESRLRGAELVEHLNRALASGRTVWILSHLRAWEVSAKTAAKWEASGRPIFKASADGANALMGQGKDYVCIDWSGWRIV